MKQAILAAIASIFLVVGVSGQTKNGTSPKVVDFSGSWQLNLKRSNFDALTTISMMKVDADQTDKDFSVTYVTVPGPPPGGGNPVGGPRKATFLYNLDGTETTSEPDQSLGMTPATLTARIADDGKLVLTSKRKVSTSFGGENYEVKETWRLEDKGKTLVISRTIFSPRTSNVVRLVLDRID